MKSIRTFPPAALTIAGSDCSGGAGIEADLKTFASRRVYGMAAITCLVAETPRAVRAIHAAPAAMVGAQIACCLEGLHDVAVKTGMLYSTPIIREVIRRTAALDRSIRTILVDPVMVATSGRRLLRANAVRAMKELILRRAELVTPNLDEARILAEEPIHTPAQMERAAAVIARRFECAVLMKGGHLRDTRWALDFFWDGQDGFWMRSPRLRGAKTHGTGCTTSAAIAAGMALGWTMPRAVRAAKRYVHSAIRRSLDLGSWSALNHHANRGGED